MKPLGVDFKKAFFNSETGFLSIPTDANYDINMKLVPMIKIDETLAPNNEPRFFAQLNVTESTLTSHKGAIKTQQELTKFVSSLPYIPENFIYSDFLIGFVYSSPQDPSNHQWFLQFRNEQGLFIDTFVVRDQVDISCPVSTFSWFDNVWHGRFKVTKNDYKTTIEHSKTHIEIIGQKCGGYPKGDTHLIPEGTEDIILRYNIETNKWYFECIKKNKIIQNLVCDNMIIDCKMSGFVERNYQKPKVTQHIKPEDVANIQLLSNTLIIQGL